MRLDKSRIVTIVNMLVIAEWMIALGGSDAFYSGYLLLGGLALYLLWNDKENARMENGGVICILSGLLSFAIALANYSIIINITQWCMMLYGGYVVTKLVLSTLYSKIASINLIRSIRKENTHIQVFFWSFFVFSVINVVYLIGWNYPGSLSPDSISQIRQILSENYSNHHPYWHTRFIGIFIQLGMMLFQDINKAIALYSIVQILLMASCFAFALMTMYQAGFEVKYLMIPFGLYAFMPYHIVYGSTIWKDILFGGAMLLTTVTLYRVVADIGKMWKNVALFFMSIIGVALFRNNGWLALLGAFALWFFFLGKKQTRMAAVFAVALLVSWVLKNPVLDYLHVEEANFRESLSIPIQQIARVIALDADISEAEQKQLEKVVDVSSVTQWYDPHISDPVKFKVDGQYIQEHKKEYLKLWLDIGLKNPGVYLHAWIEQTKGYWNGGYDYWIWSTGVYENKLGIQEKQGDIVKFSQSHLPRLFEPLFSIGMHVWAVIVLFAFNCLRGEKEKAYLAVPLIMMIGTLLIATPVYSEFRYAYSLFTVLPVYVLMSLPLEKAQ